MGIEVLISLNLLWTIVENMCQVQVVCFYRHKEIAAYISLSLYIRAILNARVSYTKSHKEHINPSTQWIRNFPRAKSIYPLPLGIFHDGYNNDDVNGKSIWHLIKTPRAQCIYTAFLCAIASSIWRIYIYMRTKNRRSNQAHQSVYVLCCVCVCVTLLPVLLCMLRGNPHHHPFSVARVVKYTNRTQCDGEYI